jgi:hypothetical protein
MKNPRARKIFEVGQDVHGARVLEVLVVDPVSAQAASPSRRLAYRVACVRCGRERVIRHSALVERLAVGGIGCRTCAQVKQPSSPVTAAAREMAISGAWR